MKQTFIGYILWDTKRDSPAHGTRRFKVWTTEHEADRGYSPEYLAKYSFEVRKVYAMDGDVVGVA